jgi:sugar-phosphatase
MDGVLVDSRPVVERTWRRWAARHGLDADALLAVAHGRRSRETIREQAPHLDLAQEVAWLDAAELADVQGIVPVPGAARLLASMPPDSWAVYTSCGPELARRRLACTALPEPRVLIASEDVPRGKPAPDGWLLAASRLGVAITDCLVVEDAPPGIAAALAAGTQVLAVTTTHPAERLGGAARIVPDLTGVTPFLREAALAGLTVA